MTHKHSFLKVNCTANDVIQVADTGSFMTAVPRGVIPVPRHWDPENLTLNKWLHNKD
ncbi:WPE palindromic element domain-containing protein [Wolbachia endosymbiont of Dactylopius coccus]